MQQMAKESVRCYLGDKMMCCGNKWKLGTVRKFFIFFPQCNGPSFSHIKQKKLLFCYMQIVNGKARVTFQQPILL